MNWQHTLKVKRKHRWWCWWRWRCELMKDSQEGNEWRRNGPQKSKYVWCVKDKIGILQWLAELKNFLEHDWFVIYSLSLDFNSTPSEHAAWWLCGELFSIADIDLAILLNRLNLLGYERRFWTEGKRPHIQAYWERIQQRSSFEVCFLIIYF